MYHGVAPDATPRFRRFVVPPAAFAAQLEHLAAAGLRGCSVSELLAEPTDGCVGLTFDDGFRELVEHALPVLERLGFTATVYVPTSFIGGRAEWLRREGESDRPILSAAELCELAAAGVEIGAHSHTHVKLDEVPPERERREVSDSKAILEDVLGSPVRSFAYPFGYHRTSTRDAVRAAGYESACAVGYRVDRGSDPYALARVPAPAGASKAELTGLLTGRGLWRARLVSSAWRPLRRSLARVRR
jgi:peptidoglycan/xylan/chitin deacetylase (PgdA/CDA1 family)